MSYKKTLYAYFYTCKKTLDYTDKIKFGIFHRIRYFLEQNKIYGKLIKNNFTIILLR